MGCDIHLYTEARRTVSGEKKWVNVDNWRINPYYDPSNEEETEREYEVQHVYRHRDYELFSFLANVRNYGDNPSFGFDGGLPDDVSEVVKREADSWGCDGHTHGYCTLEELKDAIKGVEKVRREGAVTKEEAERFRETGETPSSWAQGVGCWRGIAPNYQDRFEWLVWESEVYCFDELIAAIEERKREVFYIFNAEQDDGSHDKDFRIVFWFDN